MFHEVNAHVARFGKHTCRIEVTVGSSVAGPAAIFVAEAYVRETLGRELRPVVWRPGELVAIHSDTERQAVSGILRVLEHHLGPLDELGSASGFDGAVESRGDPWPLPPVERGLARPRPCPHCGTQTARWLETVSAPACVNYYSCEMCGHLWHVPKPTVEAPPRTDHAR